MQVERRKPMRLFFVVIQKQKKRADARNGSEPERPLKPGDQAPASTFRLVISTPPMCGAISIQWRSVFQTGRAPTRFSLPWR